MRAIVFVSVGIIGVVCLFLSVRLAHASLEHKLKARKTVKETQISVEKKQDLVGTYVLSFALYHCVCSFLFQSLVSLNALHSFFKLHLCTL